MKSICIFHGSNLGSILHPFLVKEVKLLSDISEEVHLVCGKSECGYDELKCIKNLIIHDYPAKNMKKHIFAAVPRFFSKYAFMEYKVVKRMKGFGFKYFKDCMRLVNAGDYIFRVINSIISKDINEKWVVDSYWFSNGAYAAALTKKKYPSVFAFTRAHSYEIDPVKNSFYYAGAKSFIQDYIDEILFISEKGKEYYLKEILCKYPYYKNRNCLDKCKVFRLGTSKIGDKLSKMSNDGRLRIVSCSRIDVEKRVELIPLALQKWDSVPIEWTHFGGGDTRAIDDISKKINHKLVSINIKGYSPNEMVHRYYCENSIDLLINVSSSEGIPVSIMEAQSYSIPVIATDVGGVSEIVNNENGILLSKNPTLDDIINALLQFVPQKDNIDKLIKKRNASFSNWKEKYSENINDAVLQKHIIEMIKG